MKIVGRGLPEVLENVVDPRKWLGDYQLNRILAAVVFGVIDGLKYIDKFRAGSSLCT